MSRFEIIFEQSPWFLVICALVAALYTALLYRQKQYIWSKTVHRILTGIRFVTVFIICMLLLVPMLRMLKNLIEEPTIAFVVDNSQSMTDSSSIKSLQSMEENLKEAGYNVVYNTLNGMNVPPNDIHFDVASTDLNKALSQTEQEYTNRNLIASVLVSDGIHNVGFSPENFSSYSPIYTLGIGDTTQIKDLSIQDVRYNKIAFLGNQFPVNVRLAQEGYNGQQIEVNIRSNDKILGTQSVNVTSEKFKEVEFILDAKSLGKQLYSIEITPKEGEASIVNNKRDIYLNVMDSKQRILMLCAGPHPDVKAIRQALEVQNLIETTVYYPGYIKEPSGTFDLIILHHFPLGSMNTHPVVTKYLAQKNPRWYFVGNGTDLSAFNALSAQAEIIRKSGKNDQVSGAINPAFDGFKLENEVLKKLHTMPPVTVPFANFNFKAQKEHLLYQQIGNLVSQKPLLTFTKDGSGTKNGYFFGDGLWQWKLAEYSQNGNNKGFNELIQKTVRYITTKNDRRKLRVTPVKEEFFENQPAQVDIEVYNDIYEKIYQKEVTLTVTDGADFSKKYQFVNDESKSRFSLGQLEKGLYSFTASTTTNGKIETDEGNFIVKEQYLENLSQRADFGLLSRIAYNNNGKFFNINERNQLNDELIKLNHPPKIMLTDEILEELIHQKWLFFLLVLLLSAEWALRKYSGDY